MARKKAAQNVPIRPWLSARLDCKEGRFIQIGNSFLLDKRTQKLSAGVLRLYLGMCMESAGKAQVVFTHGAGRKYGISGSSYDRYIRELIENGYIERVTDEAMLRYRPNEFRFVSAWKQNACPKLGQVQT